MIIHGIDRFRVCEPLFEAVRLVANYHGDSYSAAYLQGISGAAFTIGGICPCAPTCAKIMGPEDLLHILGYSYTHRPAKGEGEALREDCLAIAEAIKAEIRSGRPVMVFHAFTNAEWDVVAGFDEEKHTFLGRGSYAGTGPEYAAADQLRLYEARHICPVDGALFVSEKSGALNARKAELTALKQAIAHASSQQNVAQQAADPKKWKMLYGLACYDRWVSDWQNPDHKRSTGDAYCYGVYRSTHRAAGVFCAEIAPKYPRADVELAAASAAFEAEANALDAGQKLLWWEAPEAAGADRNREAAALLQRARGHYAQGIAALERALPLMS